MELIKKIISKYFEWKIMFHYRKAKKHFARFEKYLKVGKMDRAYRRRMYKEFKAGMDLIIERDDKRPDKCVKS